MCGPICAILATIVAVILAFLVHSILNPEDVWPKQTNDLYVFARTPERISSGTELSAILWDFEGNWYGPVELHPTTRTVNILKGRISFTYDSKLPSIAYIQLSNPSGFFRRQLLLVDAYIKDASDHNKLPNSNVAAYFSWNGVVKKHDHVLLKNVAYSGDVTTKYIQDKMANISLIATPYLNTVWAAPNRANAQHPGNGVVHLIKGLLALAKQSLFDGLLISGIPHIVNAGLEKLLYNMDDFYGQPGFARVPTLSDEFTFTKTLRFIGSTFGRTTSSQSIPDVYNKGMTHNSPDWMWSKIDFTSFLKTASSLDTNQREIDALHHIVTHFENDDEFGRLFLESLFCTHLQVYHWNGGTSGARDAWIRPLLSLAKVQTGDQIFFLDYSELIGVKLNAEKKLYVAPAGVILKLDSDAKLRPIAIALLKDGKWLSYLPSDKAWRVAKMFAKTAAGVVHETMTHAFFTHLIVEPFGVALNRMKGINHIVYRLLKPHLRYTIDVNFKARCALIGRGGLFDTIMANAGKNAGHLEMMRRGFESMKMSKFNFKEDMAARGFKDWKRDLPSYVSAGDALDLYEAIELYCTSVINANYPSDATILDDAELQHLFNELHDFGFKGVGGFVVPKTRTELVSILTGVIHTASVIHAAVNFPQFAHYSYVINSPLALSAPPPLPDEMAQYDTFLPPKDVAQGQMTTTWGLSRFSKDEVYMHSEHSDSFFNLDLWNDIKYRGACEEFKARLQALQERIKSRQPGIYGTRYLWLLPSLIPTSIAT